MLLNRGRPRRLGGLLALLALPLLLAADRQADVPAQAGAQDVSIHRYGLGGGFTRLTVRERRRFGASPARDMALGGFGGDLLLLDPEGGLHLVLDGDDVEQRLLGGDLPGRDWPESISADGTDWLLLVDGGGAVQRIGRRGEAKERWPLPEDRPWRRLRADRGGRIWVSEQGGGRFLVLSRAGQRLASWELETRLPGYRGPLLDWCPDERGGLYVAEGWPARVHHLNGAGNALGSWPLDLPDGELRLAVNDDDELLVAHGPEGEELHFGFRPLPRAYVLKDASTVRLLVPATEAGEAP